MKIIELKAENIKRLKAVTLKPDGKSVVIGGDNDQGKSSVLDSILYALGGVGAICDQPVREGEKRAEVTLDLGELIVTRRFTKSDSSLVVKTKSGDVKTSPQKILDKLVGSLTFDPLAFSRMGPSVQRETLAQLAGLNFAELDAEAQAIYAKRTDANREVARVKATLTGKTIAPDYPPEEIAVADVIAKLEAVRAVNAEVAETKENARRAKQRASEFAPLVEDQKRRVLQLSKELEEAQDLLDTRKTNLRNLEEMANSAREKANAVTLADETPILNELTGLQLKNNVIRSNKQIRDQQSELKRADEAAQKLDKQYTACLDKKQSLIESAKFPLEGLSVSDDAVLFNGIPLQQASSAQQIRISTAIGIALNPELRVMLIRDGAFLDGKSLAALQDLAAKSDVQLWIERVGTGEEVSVIIEDGAVKENS